MNTLHLAAVLMMVLILLLSGITKLRDRDGTIAAIKGFDVITIPEPVRPIAATVLPLFEIVLALGLLGTSGIVFVAIASIVAMTMAGFTALVVITLAKGDAPSCHCFGEFTSEPISQWTAVRNGVLTVLAIFAAYAVLPAPGLVRAVRDSSAWQVAWVFTVLIAAITLIATYLMWRRAVSERDELIEERQDRAETSAPSTLRGIPDIEILDILGKPVSLTGLARDKAQLLLFISPTCHNCHDLVPYAAMWSTTFMDQVEVALVTTGSIEGTLLEFGDVIDILPLYGDQSAVAQSSLGVAATPAAVLIGTNGTVSAGPALGASAISELVSAIVQAIGVNLVTGVAHNPSEEQLAEQQAINQNALPADGFATMNPLVQLDTGDRLPFVEAVALLGGDEPLWVLAWRDTCGFCESIVPVLLGPNGAGEVALLINEPIATVRAQGFTGPVMQVIDSDAASVLGLPGTPAGYPVQRGRKLPGGGVGGPDVLTMLGFIVTADGHVHKSLDLEAVDRAH